MPFKSGVGNGIDQRALRRRCAFALVLLAVAGCATNDLACQSSYCSEDHQEVNASGGFNGGTAWFSIPIELPPIGGVRPSLSVNYSSRGGNGEMGQGWANNAGSQLHRCPATRAMDGYSIGVRLDPSDRLCLDGMHLVVTRGTYGIDGTEYTEEVEAHVRVVEHGDLNTPGTYFVAYFQGDFTTYYQTPFTPAGASAPLAWLATRMRNSEGSVATFHYITPAPGEMLISEIRLDGYEGADDDVREGDKVVRYSYETRPDITTQYLAGGLSSQTKRLMKVVTGIDKHVPDGRLEDFKEYDFDYQTSAVTGRSELKEVGECMMSGPQTQRCHRPIQMTWTPQTLRFADPYRYGTPSPEADPDSVFALQETNPPEPPYSRSFDFDGDGRVEVLDTKPGRAPHLRFFGLGGELAHDVDIGAAFAADGSNWSYAKGDFVNLGVGALAGEVDGKLAIRSWDGHGLGVPQPTGLPYAGVRLASNFKGFGETDIMQIESGPRGPVVRYYENEDSTPGHPNFKAPVDVLTLPEPGPYKLEQRGSYLLGNGCADALVMRGGRIVDIILASDSPDGVHFKVINPADYGLPDALQDSPLYFLDINGDGLPDIAYAAASGTGPATWHYVLDTGTTFATPVDTGVPDTRSEVGVTGTITGDMANDGTEEILYPAQRLVDYCITVGEVGKGTPWCSNDKLTGRYAAYDLGIYRYAMMRFVASADGLYRPVLLPDANIVAQANLTTAMDIRGDGLTSVLSPFDPWFSNGGFKQADGTLSRCPPGYGCGLHVSINASGARADQQDAAPDLVLKVNRGGEDWIAWHYYPISNPVRAAYSVPAFDSPARYLGPANFYFTSSMYVAGDQTTHSADGDEHYRFEFGGGQYDGDGRGFRGFQWIVVHLVDHGFRQVNVYKDPFPWAGANIANWVEPESAQGDDYLKGTPSPDYIQLEEYSYDCLGPGMPEAKLAQCGPSPDGAYQVREVREHKVVRDPATHATQSDETHTYTYDCQGYRHEIDVDDEDGTKDQSCGSK